MNKTLETKLKHELSDAHVTYVKGLNAYAFYKLHNREVSEDVVQDAFAKT